MSVALADAETALRAFGLTGGQAFDALLGGLEHRLGHGPQPSPAVAAIANKIPLVPGSDLFGLAYERFFPDLFKGLRGQFFTPPPIAELLVARAEIRGGETVLDPTCGSGGLLVVAARAGAKVRGIELDPRLARLAALNLRLAGTPADVACADFFLAPPSPVDVVIANPPFSVPITDRARLDRYEMGRGKARVPSDHLFLEAIASWVRPGGRAALVVPFSLAANRSWAALRDRIDADWHRSAVCALPEGVFRPFGGAAGRAVLVWLERRGGPVQARPTMGANLTDPGYDVRAGKFRATSAAQVDALTAGRGWGELPPGAWLAGGTAHGDREVGALASVRVQRAPEGSPVVDLADVDRGTGEVLPRLEPAAGKRIALGAGDVLVSRLRPNLGNVARVPHDQASLAGSPEWIVLIPQSYGGYLLHALRTPTWRASLPETDGQTRPRTSSEAVIASRVVWPGDDVAARIDALSGRWFAARAALRAKIEALQRLVDQFAMGRIDEAQVAAALDVLEQD